MNVPHHHRGAAHGSAARSADTDVFRSTTRSCWHAPIQRRLRGAESIDERDAAAMCYTSGTTGRPKGVLYSHRSIMLHSLAQGLRDCMSIAEDDTVLPIVPMFHVNAWGLPFTLHLVRLQPGVFPARTWIRRACLSLLVAGTVTLTAGVPTVWLGVLHELDRNPGKYDLSHLRMIIIGGSAAPELDDPRLPGAATA